MKISHLSLLLSLAYSGAACSDSQFASGGSANKQSRPGDDASGDPNDPNNVDLDENGNPVDPNDPNNTDSDNQGGLNPDGTLTERFVGSLTKLEGGSDIVFAVDTSGSMSTEKSMLQQHMATFLNKFSQDNAKLDYQVFLIGDNFQFPQNLGDKFVAVKEKVGSNDALEILRDFFEGSIAQPKPIRPDTKKQIVVVTDDDAEKVNSPVFKDYVNSNPSLKGKTSVNGFVILPNSALNSWCTKAEIGNSYITLANDPDTKGTMYDLCTKDWSVLLKGLAEKILQEAPKERFALNSKPENPDDIVVTVDGTEVAESAWTYDEAANTIAFTKESAPKDGAVVKVTFKPAD